MKNLDYLLFENFHIASHHKYDVVLIARMLQSQGKSVAIFDIFHEDKEDSIEGIPVIHWKSRSQYPDDSWMHRKHTIWETLLHLMKDGCKIDNYMREVKTFIEDKADAFYCGSYHNFMSTVLFDIQKPCYWWGLRSDRFHFTPKKVLISPTEGLHILKEKRHFMRNPYQRLFVSNQIILEEHVNLGIPRERMVIREERVIEEQTDSNIEALDQEVSFLVIGQLRPQKHVPFTVEAFKKANILGATLKLIGKSQGEYENVIEKSISGDNRIIRENAFLEYSDFNKHFSESHFVLFADEQGPSCITNGTMMEALINHRPIICPDYNPYKMYVEKYDVGLLYKAGDPVSYAEAMKKAKDLGVNHFENAISSFLETISFEKVARELIENIER
ncbi:MAG: glycosyltransferase [Prevotella sp.]|nr:glycosyltransferase [Prevotella sp.]